VGKISREPMVFELLITFAWLGVAGGMTWEAARPGLLLAAPYDARGRALISICYLQG